MALPSKCMLVATLTIFLAACASLGSPSAGLIAGRLADCSPAPHCVSSLALDERHAIEPFLLNDARGGWEQLVAVVRSSERTAIVASDDRYLHAEIVSPWRFYTDDLELLCGAGGRVDVRSSSRVGYYDFQVNRQRVDALRKRLQESGVIATGSRKN